ncbi:ABC transporter ATP-binding protein [Kribbella sp. NPDC050124]|uniref:ABC transporter ATP-binding protein n=1 Tax=Kribbella sp. NPDC050124 TaxID=3364114 RepID=UPI0037912927
MTSQETESGVLLDVTDLHTHFATSQGVVKAVDGVSFELAAGESLGIVGESGSGKSITAMSVMRLIEPPGFIESGRVVFKGTDLTAASETELRRVRGSGIGLVLQDPMTALNPVYRVGDQIVESLQAHRALTKAEARERAVRLLGRLGIPAPEQRFREFPHRLSGGMRQRIVIAMAMINEPDLMILDEPTTALDMTVQAQILDLVADLQNRMHTALLLITHDIGVVSQICDRVMVMYGGRVMEQGRQDQIIDDPRHPYTIGLLESAPTRAMKGQRLRAIRGSVPSPLAMPPGCPFATRCPKAMDICSSQPPLTTLPDGRQVSCWLYER